MKKQCSAQKPPRNKKRISLFPKWLLFFAKLCFCIGAVLVFALCICNVMVIGSTKSEVLDFEKAVLLDADCILVLGAGLTAEGKPSVVLSDRLETAFQLCKNGASDRILVSGDHGQNDYDEANAMKSFLVQKGVDPDVIFADHAGFSTYDTMYRAKAVFGAKKVIVVTQDFHISRAVYIARALGLEAYGVTADIHRYSALNWYEVRETAARGAYVVKSIFKPEPVYLGPQIPLSGSGAATDG